MNLKMIRLSKPNPDNLFSNYENQLEPQYFFTSSVSKTLFENSQRTLLQISEDEIRDYINNDTDLIYHSPVSTDRFGNIPSSSLHRSSLLI